MSKNKTVLIKPKKPALNDWHRADIIAAVRKTGTNIQQLSQKMGYARTTLGNALYIPCPKYERLIAQHLGTVPQTIWPSRYHPDGSSKSGRSERGVGRYQAKHVGGRESSKLVMRKYADYMQRFAGHYQPYDIWARVSSEPGMLGTVLATYRGVPSGQFSPLAKEWMRLFVPYAARALGAMCWLRDANSRLVAAHAALNRLNTGIILLGEDGSVVLANHVAIRILEQGDGLRLLPTANGPNVLTAATAAQNKQIDAALAMALNSNLTTASYSPHGVRIDRPSGKRPIVLNISALLEVREFGLDPGRVHVMVLVTDTAQPVTIDAQLLQTLYRLTAAELRVTEQVCNGESLRAIAQRNNISAATVKTQLQSVYAKTGVERQAQLVKLVLSLSAGAN